MGEKLPRGLFPTVILLLEYWGRAGEAVLGGEAAPWGGRGTARDASLSLRGHPWQKVSPWGPASCFTRSRGWIRCDRVKVMPKTESER